MIRPTLESVFSLLRGGPVVRFIKTLLVLGIVLAFTGAAYSQDKTKGTIKGKVRVEVGAPRSETETSF